MEKTEKEIMALLDSHNIKRKDFTEDLRYGCTQSFYKAIKNPRQAPLILSFLQKNILSEKGVNLDKLIDSLK